MIGHHPTRDPDPLRERLRRGTAFLLVALAFAVLWMVLMEATEVVLIWVTRARNWPPSVTHTAATPSALKAA